MKERIEQLKKEFSEALAAAATEEALEALRVAYLGKKGAITHRYMGTLHSWNGKMPKL